MFDFKRIDTKDQSIPNISNLLFMHSNKWSEFQKAIGRASAQYSINKGEEVLGYLYIENNYRKFAKYAYAPLIPPLSRELESEETRTFFYELRKFMQQYLTESGLNVFRFDPFKWDKSLERDLSFAGFSRTLAAVGPKFMWEIELSKSEDELLADMKKVARYNIKQSEKAGIEIVRVSEEISKNQDPSSKQKELVKVFYKILEETTKRQGFSSFDLNYFLKQAEILGLGNECELFLAKYNGQFVSGAWVNYSNDTVSYTHGGSIHNPEIQKFGASYLLHWTVMKHSKSIGKRFYNMWGVVPNDEMKELGDFKNHPLRGVSDFKMRFGGHLIENLGGFETYNSFLKYILNRAYDFWVYRNDRV